MAKKTVIEIDEFSACKIIVHGEDGAKKNKSITYKKLLSMLNSASEESKKEDNELEFIVSDILPGDEIISTVQVKEVLASASKWYVLLREGKPVDVMYYNKEFMNVAMPRTLYAVKVCNNKCVNLKIACVKNGFIDTDTKLYRYPYSNVFDTKSICLGNNRINDFDIEVLSNIAMVPEMFLAMTNNNDGYYGSNLSDFNYEELLELMSNAKFDNEILRVSYNTPTYKSFIDSLK